MIGETIRDFEIQSELGSGGYGVVYRAHDTSVDRDVAIKVILPQYANQPEFVENFAAEARLVAALEHPRIVPLYSYWHDEQGAFLVMRYVRGGSLRGMLAKQGALPLNKVLRLIEQIAEALNAAHEAGVVHRDLKPDNILIDERGNAYLTDFGIAKQLSDENASATDAIKGTFAYLSPEQIQQTQVSPQTDIYALGVMLFEMLAGQHPFHETPVGMMVMKHLQEPLPDVRDLRDDLDYAISDIIHKATAKDAAERYTSTLELVDDLKAAISGVAIATPQPITPVKKKPTTNEERNRYAMLENVRKFWVEGVLENSLHDAAMIDLGLKSEPGAVDNPWDTLIRTPSGEEAITDESIVSVFDRLNGKLLILGDPGSGKTTTLLMLARDLLLRAEVDEQHPIPVVFNLSSWSENQPPLTEWLVEELNSKYQVPRKVGTQWVENDELLLLLDGLDEVSENVRDACTQAINTYRGEHGFVDIVVCSRIKDYEALTGQLKLNGAIVIQSLDDAQIVQYLDALGTDVAVVRELIARDAQLRDLAHSPLMLSIMVLAYRRMSVGDVPDFDDVESQRQHLFDVYVERMFERRIGEKPYTKEETHHYLGWLATKMQEHTLSIFHIERLQPAWLPDDLFQHWQWYPRGVYACVFGLLATVIFALVAPIVGFPVWGAILYGLAHTIWGLVWTDYKYAESLPAHIVFGLFYFVAWGTAYSSLGIQAILLAGLVAISNIGTSRINVTAFIERGHNPNIIQPVDRMIFSLKAIHPRFGLILGGFFGVAYVFAYAMFEGGNIASLHVLLSIGIGFITGAVAAATMLSITSGEKSQRTRPNEGMFDTIRNASRLTSFYAFLLAFFMLPAFMSITSTPRAIGMTLLLSPILWGFFMVLSGGYAVLQHGLLRYLLRRNDSIPTNLAQFLDYVASLVLMRKVGGGYIFIHRYLLEYFADMERDNSLGS